MSDLSKTLREGLGIATSQEFVNQKLTGNQDDDSLRFALEKLSFSDDHDEFVDVMKNSGKQLENILNQEPGITNQFTNRVLSYDLILRMKSLFDSMLSVFDKDLQANQNKDFFMEKLKTGLAVGLRFIMQLFIVIPKLLEQEGLEVNKSNFMEKAEGSFKFIDELTKLDLTHITSIESFLFGSSLQKYTVIDFQNKMSGFYQELERLGHGFGRQNALPLLRKLKEEISLLKSFPDKKGFMDPVSFEFDENGSLTMTQSAINKYLEQAGKQIGALFQLVHNINKKILGHNDLKGNIVTNFCPARSISVKTSDYKSSELKQKNLIRACFDFFLKYISVLPNLDDLLKDHVRHFETRSEAIRKPS